MGKTTTKGGKPPILWDIAAVGQNRVSERSYALRTLPEQNFGVLLLWCIWNSRRIRTVAVIFVRRFLKKDIPLNTCLKTDGYPRLLLF